MIGTKQVLTTIVSANLTILGLPGQSFAQNHEKQNVFEVRELERTKLYFVLPHSFNYKDGLKDFNKFDRDTISDEAVLPPSFAGEVIITVHDQIRRERQNFDETIMKRQKEMVEGIKRRK